MIIAYLVEVKLTKKNLGAQIWAKVKPVVKFGSLVFF